MYLHSLRLRNFRQHQETDLEFQPGLTAIIGPNGSGKTSLLEAIAWALYGARAIRGKVEDLRFAGAVGKAPVEAELEFRLGAHSYRVLRRTDTAELRVDGGPAAAAGTTAVNDAVRRLLGMDHRMFYASFFTGQKELSFMASLEGPARAVAIGRMLGYDRLTKARDRANLEKRGLRNSVQSLESTLGDGEEVKRRKQEAKAALQAARSAEEQQRGVLEAAESALEVVRPRVEASQERAAKHSELVAQRDRLRQEAERHQDRVEQLRGTIRRLEESEAQLAKLKPQLAPLDGLERELGEQNRLRAFHTQRITLQGEVTCLRDELKTIETQLADLGDPEGDLRAVQKDLGAGTESLQALDRQIQFMRDDWVGRRESGKAEWRSVVERRKEVAAHRETVRRAGETGKCPTCERPLTAELPVVLANFDTQIKQLDERLRDLQELAAQTKEPPEKLRELEARRREREAELQPLRQRATELECAVQDRARLLRDQVSKTRSLAVKEKELGRLPEGYDESRFTELQQELARLRPLEGQVKALRELLQQLPEAREQLTRSETSLATLTAQASTVQEEIEALAFDATAHKELQEELSRAETTANEARLLLVRLQGDLKAAEAAYDTAVADEKAFKERVAELHRVQKEHRYAATLEDWFEALRTLLNSRIRPELEQAASEMLSELTEGRYNTLRVDEHYNYTLVDDGEPKPVISGGEEDVVSLALRLAISEMIAERAGQPLTLLILDEVFGSLDVGRRERVMGLLNSLRVRFEQIILISHIESIHDAVDQALWVSYDPESRTSRVEDARPSEELALV